MSRIERLLNLTSALLNTERPLTAGELQRRVPGYPDDKLTFRRQFARDKETLRQLGLPLVSQALAGGDEGSFGYRIQADQYFLTDPGLAHDELSALHLAAQTVRYGGDSGVSGLWKLGTLGIAEGSDQKAIEAAAEIPASSAVASFFEAITERRAVEFRYRDETRTVAPRRLSFHNGHWYLAAFDPSRQGDRSFRVDRVEGSPRLVELDFVVPAAERAHSASNPFDSPWELGEGDGEIAIVHIDYPRSLWALGRLGEIALVPLDIADCNVERKASANPEDGSNFKFLVRNIAAFRSFVIGFLEHAEIVSPLHLRNDLLDWVECGAADHREVQNFATDSYRPAETEMARP